MFQYRIPILLNTTNSNLISQQNDYIDSVPQSAKNLIVMQIGEEFYIPEFMIAQCEKHSVNELLQYMFKIKISMKDVTNTVKKAGNDIKDAANNFYETINELLNNNNKEIEKLKKEIEEKENLYNNLDCKYIRQEYMQRSLQSICANLLREIEDLKIKLRELKLKRKSNIWSSIDTSWKQFKNNISILNNDKLLNSVKWPKSWPTIEEIQSMPVIINDFIEFPRTVIDIQIDPADILNIPIPSNIENMLNIPLNDIMIDFDDIKGQIQFDDLLYSAKEVLTDLVNKTIEELKNYNMCFFIKNSPSALQINIEYISDIEELVKSYLNGCFQMAQNAALITLLKHIPSILNSYGASIPIALSDVFLVYWSTLKKCLINVYYQFKNEIDNLLSIDSLEGFISAIEKYVSIDLVLDKRIVEWENKGSLIDLISGIVS